MEPTYVDLKFADIELAEALRSVPPPDGVKVIIAEQPTIQAAQDAGIVVEVSFHIQHGVELAFVAGWLARSIAQNLIKRHKEKTRIDRQEIAPTEAEILALMQNDLHWQQVREKQWQESQQKKLAHNKPQQSALPESKKEDDARGQHE
jgi:glucose-6-phosphate dehydrogenase assembly protein OpcA